MLRFANPLASYTVSLTWRALLCQGEKGNMGFSGIGAALPPNLFHVHSSAIWPTATDGVVPDSV